MNMDFKPKLILFQKMINMETNISKIRSNEKITEKIFSIELLLIEKLIKKKEAILISAKIKHE